MRMTVLIHAPQSPLGHMRVYLGRGYRSMAQKLLYDPDSRIIVKHVRGETVAQHMRSEPCAEAEQFSVLIKDTMYT